MEEDFDINYVWEDALTKLKNEIESEANACSIEVRLLGELLKFTPQGIYTHVFLELEQPDFRNCAVIYKHRSNQLTLDHKGKSVSTGWVIGFLRHHSLEAKEIIKRSCDRAKESRVSALNTPVAPKQSELLPKVIKANSRNENQKRAYGYSPGKGICPVCNGDGGAAGQCYKCDGSGWA